MDKSKTTEICDQMDQVRCQLGNDVEGIVESARTLTDWRHYVQTYPWACLAGAVAVGYFVVPKRVEIISPGADALEELARRNKLVVKSKPEPEAKSGLAGALFGLIATAAVRGSFAYLGNNMGKFFGETAAEGEESRKGNGHAKSAY